jgi:ethylbenzene dehydrogenase
MSFSNKPRKGFVFTSILVIILTVASSAAYFLQVPVTAQLYSNTTGSTVQGGIDLNNPGGESFWSTISGTDIPLMPSIAYSSENGSLVGYGGMVSSIKVKMAMNQTHILVFATWADPTESRSGKGVCYVLADDNVTAHERDCLENEAYGGLFYANSTYAYEDRLVFWWNLDPTPGPAPCMTESAFGHGEGQSLAGTGNLWHWKAGRTDSLGARYGKLKYGGGPGTFGIGGPNQGQIITPPHSYADNEFINITGHYQLGWDQYPTAANPGNFTIGFADNIHQTYDTFLVAAHGVHDSSTHMWKWVAARALTTTPSLHIVQFQPGQTYNFAVAVFDGGPITLPAGLPHPDTIPLLGPSGWDTSVNLPFTMYGENEETKSISSWYTASFAPTSTSSNGLFTFGSFETAALVSLGMLVVGFVAGVVIVTRFVLPKKPKA